MAAGLFAGLSYTDRRPGSRTLDKRANSANNNMICHFLLNIIMTHFRKCFVFMGGHHSDIKNTLPPSCCLHQVHLCYVYEVCAAHRFPVDVTGRCGYRSPPPPPSAHKASRRPPPPLTVCVLARSIQVAGRQFCSPTLHGIGCGGSTLAAPQN